MKQNKVILVAESNDDVYALISSALGTAPGQAVVRLRSGGELADLLFSGRPDKRLAPDTAYVLLLDENCLESTDGNILWRMKEDSLLTRIPIVMLTGRQEARGIAEYQAMGASACVLKSDAPEALAGTMSGLGEFLAVVQAPQL